VGRPAWFRCRRARVLAPARRRVPRCVAHRLSWCAAGAPPRGKRERETEMSVPGEGLIGPYRGLAAFDDSDIDALFFFGRERETEVVVANALASRLTILYGPTGVGKTSLLRAGVVHAIRQLAADEPIAVAVVDSWTDDPVPAIEQAARTALT